MDTDNSYPSALLGTINSFGLLVVYNTIGGLHLFAEKKSLKARCLIIGSLFIQIIALVIVQPRTCLVLFVGACAAFFLPFGFRKHQQPHQPYKWYLFYGIAGLMLALPIVFWSDAQWLRITEFITKPFTEVSSISSRLSLYEVMWKLFLHHPLWGAGVGNFIYLGNDYWPESLRRNVSFLFFMDNGHCDYLQTLCELGIIGFVLTMILWLGALARGIKIVYRRKERLAYSMLILLTVLFFNAAYSIESRRIPLCLLLWSTIGYFWKDSFIPIWQTAGVKARRTFIVIYFTIHCLLFGLFLQILVGDFYVYKASGHKTTETLYRKYLNKAFAFYPDHPNALFLSAFLSAQEQKYRYALSTADRLEKIEPNFWPTDYIRAYSYFNLADYPGALQYADKQIKKRPTFLPAFKIKINTLARLGRCGEMQQLKDSVVTGFFIQGRDNNLNLPSTDPALQNRLENLEIIKHIACGK